jgi:hypothetical protein
MDSRKPFDMAIKKDKVKKAQRGHPLTYGEDVQYDMP